MFRKLIVIAVCAIVLTMAGLPAIVAALNRAGVLPLARALRSEYLTGTAITVIVALLILIPSAGCMRFESRPARCPCVRSAASPAQPLLSRLRKPCRRLMRGIRRSRARRVGHPEVVTATLVSVRPQAG